MKSALTLVVILQLSAVFTGLAEIFIPSAGILSLISGGLFGYSLFLAFTEISRDAGLIVLSADVVIVPCLVVLGFKLLGRSPATLTKTLARDEGVVSQSPSLEKLPGEEGTCLTDLRPAGTALLGGKRIDVSSRGEFLDKGSKIVVLKVTGNKVIVKKTG